MIKTKSKQCAELKPNMRGGEGTITVTHLFDYENEIKAPQRLFARMNFPIGGSIGSHDHIAEEEVYYIIKGTAEVDDNGIKKRLQSGDAMLTGNGASHAIKNVGQDELEILAVITLYPKKEEI